MTDELLTGADLGALSLKPKAMTLLVGWRERGSLHARSVECAGKVREALLEYAQDTLTVFADLRAIEYDHSDVPGEDEFFVFRAPQSTSANDSPDSDFEHSASELIDILGNAGSFAPLTPSEVREGNYLFYAVVAQNMQGEAVAFVRRQLQLKLAQAGKLFTVLGERLDVLAQPVFAFSERYDFIVHNGQVAMLDSYGIKSFEALFTDLDLLRNATPEYCSEFVQNIHMDFADGTYDLFEQVCQKQTSLASRVRRVRSAPHLARLSIDDMRADLAEFPEIAGGMTIVDDRLVMTTKDVKSFLDLVEQRVWKGRYDGDTRVAQVLRQLRRKND